MFSAHKLSLLLKIKALRRNSFCENMASAEVNIAQVFIIIFTQAKNENRRTG